MSNPSLELRPSAFQTHFRGWMTLYATPEKVAAYLNDHQQWFCRCATPMRAEPLGDNGYILTIGRFGALGYEVEPQIAVVLDPPQQNTYQMYTVSLPDLPFLGYEVDYRATMELVELEELDAEVVHFFEQHLIPLPDSITQIHWQLDMEVIVYFPAYIYRLPRGLIQTSGDRLLTEIVRQVSPRLTYKVQKDFHQQEGLGIAPKSSRFLERVLAP